MAPKRKAPAGGKGSAAGSKHNKKAKKTTGKGAAAAKDTKKKTGAAAGKKAPGAAAGGGKKTKGTVPQLPENTDDVEVDEDDHEFFEENAKFSSFLVNMDAKRLAKGMFTKGQATKPVRVDKKIEKVDDAKDAKINSADEPLEKMEARPRRPGWNTAKVDLTNKLPVKFMDGSVRMNKLMAETVDVSANTKAKAEGTAAATAEENDDDIDPDHMEDIVEDMDSDISDMEFEEVKAGEEEEEAAAAAAEEAQKPLTEVDLRIQRQRRLAEKKIQIAQLCESILESPEDALKKNKEHPDGFSKVQELHELCSDPDMTVQKLAMLSELSVFLDILPDYRIRLQQQENEKTNGRPLKKKVQQMQDFEASMLNNYQIYLKKCAQVVKDGLRGKGPNHELTANDKRGLSIAETGAKCLGELMKVKYSFNFHLNLIVALVPMADSRIFSA